MHYTRLHCTQLHCTRLHCTRLQSVLYSASVALSRRAAPSQALRGGLLEQLLGARRGLLGLISSSLTAEETEQLLNFASLSTDFELRLADVGGGAAALLGAHAAAAVDAAVGSGSVEGLLLVRERAALTIAELCEATGRGALPSTVQDHLRAAGAPAVLTTLSLLGSASESLRTSGIRILGVLLKLLQPKKDRERDPFSLAFAKLQGWEMAARALATQRPSARVCYALLALASGEKAQVPHPATTARCAGRTESIPAEYGGIGYNRAAASVQEKCAAGVAGPTNGAGGARASDPPGVSMVKGGKGSMWGSAELQLPNELVLPSALQLLLDGIRGCGDGSLQLQLVGKLESIVEASR